MTTKAKRTKSLFDVKNKYYGKRRTKKREALEEGFEIFKIGYLIKEARQKRDLPNKI